MARLEPDAQVTARRGLLRLHDTLEFGREEMTERLTASTVETIEDLVEQAQYWSNAEAFQVGVRMMRGHLLPVEAGLPLSNIADGVRSEVSGAILRNFVADHGPIAGRGVVLIALGDLGQRSTRMGSDVTHVLLHAEAVPGKGRFNPADHAREWREPGFGRNYRKL